MPDYTVKDNIIEYANNYLLTNSVFNLNDFIKEQNPASHTEPPFIRDTAYRFQQTGLYIFKEENGIFLIYRNPNYDLNRSIIQTNRIQKAVLFLTLSVSIFSAAIAYFDFKKESKGVTIQLEQMPSRDTLIQNADTLAIKASHRYSIDVLQPAKDSPVKKPAP